MYTFIEYPKCSTCQKAKKFLDANKVKYASRNIKEEKLSADELISYFNKSGLDIKRLFNTSGLLYKELKLKEKLDSMTFDEKIELLSSDGMLVKRPIFVTDAKVYFGFKEDEWKDGLK